MANDEIRDLIGRYATGSLSDEEQKRLFDAALDDQDLFDELAREQEMKSLIDEPGARDRLIRALEPPKRKVTWIFALVPVAAAIVFAILFVYQDRLHKPAPQSSQVAMTTTPAPKTEIATAGKPPAAQPVEPPMSRGEPAGNPRLRDKASEPPPRALEKKVEGREAEDRKTLDQKEEAKKDAAKDQVAAAPPPPPKEKQEAERKAAPEAKSTSEAVQVQAVAPQVQRYDAQQQNAQNAPGGPRQQNAAQQSAARKTGAALPAAGASAGLLSLPPFGFHYSVETSGHLIIIPAADGTLSVKSGDGRVLLPSQRVAVGITNDIALPDSVRSVTIVFSRGASPPQITPATRTAPQGDEQGQNAVAIELKINP